MDQEQPLTEYDALVHSQDIQLLKSMLPFADSGYQMTLAIFIQFIEFKNTIQIFKNNRNGLSASSNSNENDRQNALMQTLLKQLPKSEQETMDNLMNMINMMSMMNSMENAENIMENYEDLMKSYEISTESEEIC